MKDLSIAQMVLYDEKKTKSSDKIFFTLKKICAFKNFSQNGSQNGSSLASLKKKHFWNLYFNIVLLNKDDQGIQIEK